MEYEATVCRLDDADYYDGYVTISILVQSLRVYYQTSMEFALEKLTPGAVIVVDLWHVWGHAVKADVAQKAFVTSPSLDTATIRGQVVDVMSLTEFRVDCGMLIDVDNRDGSEEIAPGDIIETSGCCQIYFPGTEWDKEAVS
ncbi:MAG: hypothetical protein VB144_12555 [Clostridia bacterium]|nr:hypothetical protein [Clostridia bacterium]